VIECADFYKLLKKAGVDFFAGVPDSLLKGICAYITDTVDETKHIIAANEGNAVALACGHHLATGKIPLVYLQNSGIGNTMNPLVSLTDPEVYGIPMLLLVGWRGRPGEKDEPQHVKQGKITTMIFESIGLPYDILSQDLTVAGQQLDRAVAFAKENSTPYALIVIGGTFGKHQLRKKFPEESMLEREKAIQLVADSLDDKNSLILATTGKISRELYEHRVKTNGRCSDFLNVGSMGHVSQIALGVALSRPRKKIYCFDGDGAALMHMGGMGIVGCSKAANFKHVIFNNGSHDSVGGQPTIGTRISFVAIARGCNYTHACKVSAEAELTKILPEFIGHEGPSLLEIVVKRGSRDNLARPKERPVEIKCNFMDVVKR